METKEALRKRILQERKAFTPKRLHEISQVITERILNSDVYKNANSVHCYASIKDQGEINTFPLMQEILNSNRHLVMSKMIANKQLQHFQVPNLSELKVNSFGIAQPQMGTEIAPEEPELIIVPLLAADQRGNRLGYGAGYYDRFLKKTKGIRLGICSHNFLLEYLPKEPHDVPLSALVTDKIWMDFNL